MKTNLKNALISIMLVIVIIVAAFFIARSLGLFGNKNRLPESVTSTPEERIDIVTFAVMTKTFGQWQKLGQKEGAFLNPETKTYTMVLPMKCGVCGEQIPMLQFPANLKREPVDAAELLRIETEKTQLMTQYMCPKCGKRAYTGYDSGLGGGGLQ